MTLTTRCEESLPRAAWRWIVAMIVIVGLAPPVAYWFYFACVPTLTPEAAKERLTGVPDSTVLVDVRSAETYRVGHLTAAENWPIEKLLDAQSREDIPSQFHGKTLLLLCQVGIESISAVEHLEGLGSADVYHVRGGVQEWIGSATSPEGGPLDAWQTASGEIIQASFRESPGHEQLAVIIHAFVGKVSYSIASLVLVILLWRKRSPDLAALRWAMLFFFLGENACTLNYVIFNERSYLFEYLHSYGMILSFSFTIYAVLEGFDRRILRLSDPERKCAALRLCSKCIKYNDVPCGLKRMFLILIPACIVLAFMPLCADWYATSYNTMIYTTFYNYTHLMVYQIYENVACPTIAIVLLTASLLILACKKEDPISAAKIAFAAGVGPLGFAWFRMVLGGAYTENLAWFNFWEEITEWLFIAGVCATLWVFRRGLLHSAGEE